MADDADRGALSVDDRVVLKVAEAAAAEVPGVAPRSATGGTGIGRVLSRPRPHATARTSGTRAEVHLDVAVLWPSPAAQVAAAVRDGVRTRLHDLAGVDADVVDVTVSAFVTPAQLARRSGPAEVRRVR